MKTKLSFLALPLCLGLMLAFVLAACGGDSGSGGGGDGEKSSSSYTQNYSKAEDPTVNIPLDVLNVTCDPEGKCTIPGFINAMGSDTATGVANLIQSVTFNAENVSWFSDKDGRPLSGPITPNIKSVKLSSYASVDITRTEIPCGEHKFTVTACTDAAKKKCGNVEGSFVKPDSYCRSSSSGGAEASSSSSEIMWVFGDEQQKTFKYGEIQTISDNVKFQLVNVEDGSDGYIKAERGSIRSLLGVPCNDMFDDTPNTSGYPRPGVGYPNRKFSSLGNPTPILTVEAGFIRTCYNLICSENETEKYLIMLDEVSGSDSWQARYWKVVTGP